MPAAALATGDEHFRLAGAEPQYGGLSRAGSLQGAPVGALFPFARCCWRMTLPPHAESLHRVNGTQAAVPMNCPTIGTSIKRREPAEWK